MEEVKCKKCEMPADSPMAYKCDSCGEEAQEHDPNHECGGEHCVVKCSGCKESETNCTC